MASKVLTVIFAIVFLNKNSQGSLYPGTSLAHHHHHHVDLNEQQLNDNTILKWNDLRNEVRQGDAITFELGTPQYQIVNADEPLEIITAGQPGYYESLRQYEQAGQVIGVDGGTGDGNGETDFKYDSSPTAASPEETIEEQGPESIESQRPYGGKQIKFIILNSRKKTDNGDLYVDMPKYEREEKASIDETRDSDSDRTRTEHLQNKNDEYVCKPQEPENENMQTTPSYEAPRTEETTETIYNSNSLQLTTTTTELPSAMENEKFIHPTEVAPTEAAESSTTTAAPTISPQMKSINPAEEAAAFSASPVLAPSGTRLHHSSPLFLALGTKMTDMIKPSPNSSPEMTYAVIPQQPQQMVPRPPPPHIRDFEYLYRSALAMNNKK